MKIWQSPISLPLINQRNQNTLASLLEIYFTEIGDNYLTATMQITKKVKQPRGIVHGGANVVLAETIASTAANYAVDNNNFYCVGLEINANHIRSVTTGTLTGVAQAIHLGRLTQIWEIKIFNEKQKITCISRMTAAVLSNN